MANNSTAPRVNTGARSASARIGRLAALVGAGLLIASAALPGSVAGAAVPGSCHHDSKLIGPILLSTDDAPGTWWRLTRDGFDAAGVTDYQAMIEGFFGTSFDSPADAVKTLVAAVAPLDKNGNGFVCASASRGTRASLGDPMYAYYFFGVIDDKHVK